MTIETILEQLSEAGLILLPDREAVTLAHRNNHAVLLFDGVAFKNVSPNRPVALNVLLYSDVDYGTKNGNILTLTSGSNLVKS